MESPGELTEGSLSPCSSDVSEDEITKLIVSKIKEKAENEESLWPTERTECVQTRDERPSTPPSKDGVRPMTPPRKVGKSKAAAKSGSLQELNETLSAWTAAKAAQDAQERTREEIKRINALNLEPSCTPRLQADTSVGKGDKWTYQPHRSGKGGGRDRDGVSGGKNKVYYAGYYSAKARGKAALAQYKLKYGEPPTSGGSAYHARSRTTDRFEAQASSSSSSSWHQPGQ